MLLLPDNSLSDDVHGGATSTSTHILLSNTFDVDDVNNDSSSNNSIATEPCQMEMANKSMPPLSSTMVSNKTTATATTTTTISKRFPSSVADVAKETLLHFPLSTGDKSTGHKNDYHEERRIINAKEMNENSDQTFLEANTKQQQPLTKFPVFYDTRATHGRDGFPIGRQYRNFRSSIAVENEHSEYQISPFPNDLKMPQVTAKMSVYIATTTTTTTTAAPTTQRAKISATSSSSSSSSLSTKIITHSTDLAAIYGGSGGRVRWQAERQEAQVQCAQVQRRDDGERCASSNNAQNDEANDDGIGPTTTPTTQSDSNEPAAGETITMDTYSNLEMANGSHCHSRSSYNFMNAHDVGTSVSSASACGQMDTHNMAHDEKTTETELLARKEQPTINEFVSNSAFTAVPLNYDDNDGYENFIIVEPNLGAAGGGGDGGGGTEQPLPFAHRQYYSDERDTSTKEVVADKAAVVSGQCGSQCPKQPKATTKRQANDTATAPQPTKSTYSLNILTSHAIDATPTTPPSPPPSSPAIIISSVYDNLPNFELLPNYYALELLESNEGNWTERATTATRTAAPVNDSPADLADKAQKIEINSIQSIESEKSEKATSERGAIAAKRQLLRRALSEMTLTKLEEHDDATTQPLSISEPPSPVLSLSEEQLLASGPFNEMKFEMPTTKAVLPPSSALHERFKHERRSSQLPNTPTHAPPSASTASPSSAGSRLSQQSTKAENLPTNNLTRSLSTTLAVTYTPRRTPNAAPERPTTQQPAGSGTVTRRENDISRAASYSSMDAVLPSRTLLRRQRRMASQDSVDKDEDPIERLNRLRARISGALSEVKGVLNKYSTETEPPPGEAPTAAAVNPMPKPVVEKPAEGPVQFRFVRKVRRRSVFAEEDEATEKATEPQHEATLTNDEEKPNAQETGGNNVNDTLKGIKEMEAPPPPQQQQLQNEDHLQQKLTEKLSGSEHEKDAPILQPKTDESFTSKVMRALKKGKACDNLERQVHEKAEKSAVDMPRETQQIAEEEKRLQAREATAQNKLGEKSLEQVSNNAIPAEIKTLASDAKTLPKIEIDSSADAEQSGTEQSVSAPKKQTRKKLTVEVKEAANRRASTGTIKDTTDAHAALQLQNCKPHRRPSDSAAIVKCKKMPQTAAGAGDKRKEFKTAKKVPSVDRELATKADTLVKTTQANCELVDETKQKATVKPIEEQPRLLESTEAKFLEPVKESTAECSEPALKTTETAKPKENVAQSTVESVSKTTEETGKQAASTPNDSMTTKSKKRLTVKRGDSLRRASIAAVEKPKIEQVSQEAKTQRRASVAAAAAAVAAPVTPQPATAKSKLITRRPTPRVKAGAKTKRASSIVSETVDEALTATTLAAVDESMNSSTTSDANKHLKDESAATNKSPSETSIKLINDAPAISSSSTTTTASSTSQSTLSAIELALLSSPSLPTAYSIAAAAAAADDTLEDSQKIARSNTSSPSVANAQPAPVSSVQSNGASSRKAQAIDVPSLGNFESVTSATKGIAGYKNTAATSTINDSNNNNANELINQALATGRKFSTTGSSVNLITETAKIHDDNKKPIHQEQQEKIPAPSQSVSQPEQSQPQHHHQQHQQVAAVGGALDSVPEIESKVSSEVKRAASESATPESQQPTATKAARLPVESNSGAQTITTASASVSTEVAQPPQSQPQPTVESKANEHKMPELQILPTPVQAVQIPADNTKFAPLNLPREGPPKKKIIFKKILRQKSTEKAPQETKNESEVAEVEAISGLAEKEAHVEAATETESPVTEVPPAPPAPPKKPRKVKKKVIIKRQQRRLSISDQTFFSSDNGSEQQIENAKPVVTETLEKAIAYCTDDEDEDSAELVPDAPLKGCMRQREFDIGDLVMYAERYKRTQVRWKKGRVLERITSISYKLEIEGKEVPAHISYIKRYTDRKVSFGGKEYLEIDYEQIAEEAERARTYSIWNMV